MSACTQRCRLSCGCEVWGAAGCSVPADCLHLRKVPLLGRVGWWTLSDPENKICEKAKVRDNKQRKEDRNEGGALCTVFASPYESIVILQ